MTMTMPLFTEERVDVPQGIVPLRDYQDAAVAAIQESWWADGLDRILLVLPTGTGKTIVFSEIIRQEALRGNAPALIIAHRDELIEQAVHKYKMISPDADVGVVKAERNELDHQVVVASIQTVSGSHRLQQLASRHFPIVVIDEAHHATARTYMETLDALGAFAGKCKTLGVTATPNRGDKVGLNNVFESIVYEAKLLDMIARGYLCDMKAQRVQVPIDLSKIKTSRGDYQQGDLDRAMGEAHAEEIIATAVAATAKDRKKILAFTPGVRSAHALSVEMTKKGMPTGVVDGNTPIQLRRQTISDFSKGKTQAIANCGVLTEGYDEPYVDCIVMARPTRSAMLYQQCVGRGTRTAPGKKDCLIIDLVGVTSEHKMVTLSSLTGLPLTKQEQDAITKNGGGASSDSTGPSMSLLDIMRQFGTVVDGKGQIVSSAVELFDNSWAQWLPSSGKWILPAGKSIFVLTQNGVGMWDVWEKTSTSGRKMVTAGLDLGYAQGIAESRAKGLAEVLTAKDAKWRSQPITDNQLEMFKKLRIDQSRLNTRGEASDAITVAIAMKGWN